MIKKLLLTILILSMAIPAQAGVFGRNVSTNDNTTNVEDGVGALVVDMDAVAGQQATSITIWTISTTAAKDMICGIYDEDDDALLAETEERSIGPDVAPDWETFSFGTPFSLTSGKTYILACHADAGGGLFYVTYDAWDAGMSSRIKFSVSYANEMPSTFPAGYLTDSGDACIYATYEAIPSTRRIMVIQ